MNKRKNYTIKFFKVFFISIIPFTAIATIFLTLYVTANNKTYDPKNQKNSVLSLPTNDTSVKEEKKSIFTPPTRTNVLVVGLKKGEYLTDTMMVLSFVSTTGEINILSIPRDTYTNFTGDALKNLRKANKNSPSIMKANAIYMYSKKKMDILMETIENMLSIKLDYFVKIDPEAFVHIVDSVGGIYFDVPKGGLKYSDPNQNLYINLKEGNQLLDGKNAEGLVRFRKSYGRADLQRVEVQQKFVKEFITQVLNKETIMKNLGSVVFGSLKYIDTDFNLLDVPKYLALIPNIKINKMQNETLPGYPKYINGVSYFIQDKEKTKAIVDNFFYGETDPDKITTESTTKTEN